MRILILGIDGYIGWPLALQLKNKGHEVFGIDNLSRRKLVHSIGSGPIIPIRTMGERAEILGVNFTSIFFDITIPQCTDEVLKKFQPEVIVHLAEQPSAPYSMISQEKCINTIRNNVLGTINLLYSMKRFASDAHLIKLGTMGEYGTPNCDIPEGKIPAKCLSGFNLLQDCSLKNLPFPKSPGSFYHATKCFDSIHIELACKIWGLRCTDIMQGVVYGTSTPEIEKDPERLATRFDYDQYFGTVINRFCAQAVTEHPLTIYGDGTQKRSFLPLQDSIQCINLIAENIPNTGEYRVINQFSDVFSINEIASLIVVACGKQLNAAHWSNIRMEVMDHHYQPANKTLIEMGYKPSPSAIEIVRKMLIDLAPHRSRIHKEVIIPTTTWRHG